MKTCPQCGAEQALDAKFCTKCGYKFPVAEAAVGSQNQTSESAPQPAASQQPAPAQTNESLQKAKALGQGYWSWFVAGLKHPGQPTENANKWYGLISLGLIGLFNMIAVIRPLANTVNSVTSNYGGSIDSAFGTNVEQQANQVAGSTLFGTGVRMFILFVVIGIVLGTAAWLADLVISRQSTNYLVGLTNFGFRVSPSLLVSAIAALIGLFSGITGLILIFLLFVLNYALQNIAFFQMALEHPAKTGMDPQYSIFLINLGTSIINIIVFIVFGSSLFSMLSHLSL